MIPVYNRVNKGRGRIVTSNHPKIEKEIGKSVKKWQTERKRAGKPEGEGVKWIPLKDVTAAEKALPALEKQRKWTIRSDKRHNDDRHILALAKASGAKLLCSNDDDLGKDFEKLFQGQVYKRGLSRKKQDARLNQAVCL